MASWRFMALALPDRWSISRDGMAARSFLLESCRGVAVKPLLLVGLAMARMRIDFVERRSCEIEVGSWR